MAHPTQVEPERWANGGGWTRTLLAWPDPARWALRISVADVEQAGPFSAFPGVDRWFAVLEGDGVRLATAGHAPVAVRTGDVEMHAFPGDVATDCELLGGATRDLNVMVRRHEARATIRLLRDSNPRSDAELLTCFVCDAAALTTDDAPPIPLAPHTLAWLENPARETLTWKLAAPAPRGWWVEVNRADR
jgi:environmental stress-induced protein Ves